MSFVSPEQSNTEPEFVVAQVFDDDTPVLDVTVQH